jgi:hypothetical protein
MKRKMLLSPDPEEMVFLRQYIAENGQRLLGESGPPRSVLVTRQGWVWRIVLMFGDRERNLVVKDIRGNTCLPNADQLRQVQGYIGSMNPRLRESFPEILAVVPERGWIVMQYVSGSILEDLIYGLLRGNGKGKEAVNACLPRVIDVFLAMKNLNLQSSDLAFLSETKGKFLTHYETLFRIGWIRRYLPFPFRTYEKFTSGFDRQLLMQPFIHLVPGDCQPKNIIITEAGIPCLIDPDYARSNVFLAMAKKTLLRA